ncbi:MAG TPA: hydrogen gas-evolving membrane-bound hydrogenase subunit E, partial [Acidimicrobiales bacterium]|nr:hydrogen gas-evolving membrane-bound hydrogenase subunit E [Acidimicrobiales bacterium]
MIALLLAHAAAGLAILAAGRRAQRGALALAAVPSAATLVWLAVRAGGVVGGDPVRQSVAWVPELGIDLDLRLDGFSALFVLLIAGIGVLIFAYSARYLPATGEGLGRLIGLLVLFAGSMVGLVLADNLVVLFGFWELTSVTSFLLIGHDHASARARAAALQALLVTGTGGLAMLAGFVLIGQAAGTYRLSAVLADPPSGGTVTAGLVLVLVGAFAKSAQYPFHSWLPGAMVAPTPVSAYLHSATMVKAGVYLVGRFAPAFAGVVVWRPLVVTVGLVTMVAGGLRALRQHDLKLLLAFGTVSQLGFMVVLLGIGTAPALVAGCALVLAHGLFKAALFMVVGIIEHQAGTRDLRRLRPWGPAWRPVSAVTAVSAASMAGVPLTFGFIAKEEDFAALAGGPFSWSGLVLALVVAGSTLTAAYSLRFAWGALGRAGARDPGASPGPAAVAPPGPAFLAPAALLAAATVVLGIAPALVDRWAGGAARALDPTVEPVHLALWHGLNLPLALSAVVLAGGAALFAGRRRLAPVLAAGGRLPSGSEVYLAVLRGVNAGADRVTAVVQNGSLPTYAGVILTTAALLTTGALVAGGGWPGWPALVGSLGHLAVCAALLVTAVAAATVHRRFSAALLVGATGYAMAGLFVVQGGADLALTQVAIETLSTVLFVLVLRRLPDRFESRAPLGRRAVRAAAALSVGVTVFALAITASGNRQAEPISGEMVERSVPDGGGRNVVNVILVDFRGFDTLGEITVLSAAAVGVVALARAGRRPGAAGQGPEHRLRVRHLVVVDVAVRLVVPAVLVGSLY